MPKSIKVTSFLLINELSLTYYLVLTHIHTHSLIHSFCLSLYVFVPHRVDGMLKQMAEMRDVDHRLRALESQVCMLGHNSPNPKKQQTERHTAKDLGVFRP